MSTFRLSKPSPVVRTTTAHILSKAKARSSNERAVAIYNFVRDSIEFGFTPYFDSATPEQTLFYGRGHCNPQGALLASLLNAAGIPARQHFVALSPGVLYGVLPAPPEKLIHSFVEADMEGGTVRLDGYIADPRLWRGAKAKLQLEGREQGWGIHSRGSIDWDGREDVFSQMADEKVQVSESFGAWDEPQEFLNSRNNFQKLPWPLRMSFGLFTGKINSRIEAVRDEAEAVRPLRPPGPK